MLVFKKNWLYKYNEWCVGNICTNDNVNSYKSICPYFWGSFWNLIPVNLIYFVFANIPLVLSLMVLSKDYVDTLSGWSGYFIMLGVGYLTFVVMICVLGVFIYLQERWSQRKRNEKISNNVVVEYIKAKKSKICPMIKWED